MFYMKAHSLAYLLEYKPYKFIPSNSKHRCNGQTKKKKQMALNRKSV